MAQVTRCDKCGDLGDGRYFGKMVVYPPNQLVDDVVREVSSQGFSVRTNAAKRAVLELDVCHKCYQKFSAPAPFQIASAEVKWEGEETTKS